MSREFRTNDAGRSGPTAATAVRVYSAGPGLPGGVILDLSRNGKVEAPNGMLAEVILDADEVAILVNALHIESATRIERTCNGHRPGEVCA